ncbi:MAG: leucine-rich repeat domain-containing protein [Candidatus Poribacteria bacterium]|nr:leucine-rich repeat domain-containing protein [Candidatus Poribacteria bacterium]
MKIRKIFRKSLKIQLLLVSIVSMFVYNTIVYAEDVKEWMPDANLRQAVRETLELTTNEPLTKEKMQGFDFLDAHGRDIMDITGLEFAMSLEVLHLSKNPITDLRPLANLTRLEKLHLWSVSPNTPTLDIRPLSTLINLEVLSLWKTKISTDISPLSALKKLRTLDISHNQIEDIRPLAGLTELQTLAIEVNLITDLTPLSELNLIELIIGNNPITDIHPLSTLINLEMLILENCEVFDISPLSALKKLRILDLTNNQIEDIRSLAALTGLRTLWIKGNPIRDLNPLSELNLTDLKYDAISDPIGQTDPAEAWMPDAALRAAIRGAIGVLPGVPLTKEKLQKVLSLNVENKGIYDVTGLEFATSLTELAISQNSITDLRPLSNLTQLVKLYFEHVPENSMDLDLRPLSTLINLEVLSLWNTWISADISALAGLKKLRVLELSSNQIEDISLLEGLTELRILQIKGSPIKDLHPLANLTNLRRLYLSDVSPITLNLDISPLANLIHLEVLFLENCKVSDISLLAGLKKLRVLDLSNNQILDFSPLAGLTELRTLLIRGNWTHDISPLVGLMLTDFEYDEICEIAPPEPLIIERILTKNYPAIFQGFNSNFAETAEELALYYPGTDPEVYHQRAARNDLYFSAWLNLDFILDTPPYERIATRIGGNLERARAVREKQLTLNPNLVFIVQPFVVPFLEEFPPDTDLFLKDANGQLVYWSGKPYLNIVRPEAQQLWINWIVAIAECGLLDGVVLDGFLLNRTAEWRPLHKELSASAGREITDEDIIKIHRHIFRSVREKVHPNFLILVNANVTRPDRYADLINGSFMESDRWHLTTRNGLRHMEAVLSWNEENLRAPQVNCLEGRALEGPSHSPENLRQMRLVTTLSLTHSDGYVDYSTHVPEDAGGHRLAPWYDFWDANLGQPIGEKAQLCDNCEGLFIREFTDGWAIYNRSGKVAKIQLPMQATGVASGITSTIHIVPDLDGEMYLKQETDTLIDISDDNVVKVLDLLIGDPQDSPPEWMQDAALNAAVRENLGLPIDSPLTKEKMLWLEHLDATHKGIVDITGLEFATNLKYLYLGGRNRITDLSPLVNLTSLTNYTSHIIL